MRADGNSVGDFVNEIELFDGDLVDFVENVDRRNVNSVSFNNVDQHVCGCVFVQCHIRVVDLVFFQN